MGRWATSLRRSARTASSSAWARRLRRLAADQRATSDVEYVLVTAMVVLPLFVIPPMLIRENVAWFERTGWWINLPFP
jgi:hypothetical protein